MAYFLVFNQFTGFVMHYCINEFSLRWSRSDKTEIVGLKVNGKHSVPGFNQDTEISTFQRFHPRQPKVQLGNCHSQNCRLICTLNVSNGDPVVRFKVRYMKWARARSIKTISIRNNELHYCGNLDCPCSTPQFQRMAELAETILPRSQPR